MGVAVSQPCRLTPRLEGVQLTPGEGRLDSLEEEAREGVLGEALSELPGLAWETVFKRAQTTWFEETTKKFGNNCSELQRAENRSSCSSNDALAKTAIL